MALPKVADVAKGNMKKQHRKPMQVHNHQIKKSSVKGCTSDGELSPTKALRVAMLKKRFADIIFKENHKDPPASSCHLEANALKMQQERGRLKRSEKARIEKDVKAAEAALKIQRAIEREAARIALDKIVKTVEFNCNSTVMQDFEVLLRCNN